MRKRSKGTCRHLAGPMLAFLALAAPAVAHSDEPPPVTLEAACKHAAQVAAAEPGLGPDDAKLVHDSCLTTFAPAACADAKGAAACVAGVTGLGELDGCGAQFCDPAGGNAPSIMEDPSTLELAVNACKKLESLDVPLPNAAKTVDACGQKLVDQLVAEQCIDPIGALFCMNDLQSADGVDACGAMCQLPAGE